MHAGEEVVREERLQSELDAKALVLVFGLGHAADDENGKIRLEFAKAGDELGAGHAGHDVVGEDEIDGLGKIVISQLLKCTLGAEDGDDEVAARLRMVWRVAAWTALSSMSRMVADIRSLPY
jgi:hypothetical protein